MGLFKSKQEGGMMDIIRCDQVDFLIWKWRPDSSKEAGSSKKENGIRYGSSLRVKPGQAAVFLYQNKSEYDVILGPYDDVIKTDNFPILSSILGVGFSGSAPFQAEVYYINLSKGMEIPFVVPFFRVIPAEPEYKAYDIRVAIKGSITFEIPSDVKMIKYLLEAWGSSDTSIQTFNEKASVLISQEVKRIVSSAPAKTGIYIMHFNALIGELGQYILVNIQPQIAHRFGVFASSVLIDDIRYDEDGDGYKQLMRITQGQAHIYNLENEKNALLNFELKRQTMQTDTDVRNDSMRQMSSIQLEHLQELNARMREEAQFAQHVQTEIGAKRATLEAESDYIAAHTIDRQSDVLQTGMESLGQMGSINFASNNGQFNPAGLMAGMMMGSAVGRQAMNMMNQLGESMTTGINNNPPQQTPPPIPNSERLEYYLAVDGQQLGPVDTTYIKQLLQANKINENTLCWHKGLSEWTRLCQIPTLSVLFSSANCPPPIPNV